MLSISSLIEFLLDLLRDEDTQAEFARDPQGVLARHGLEGLTAADVRDVQPMLADVAGVSHCGDDDGDDARAAHHHDSDGGSRHRDHDDDPVRAIQHVSRSYEVDKTVVVHRTTNEYHEHTHVEFNQTVNNIDNRVHAEEGATVVQDSFNQDNDGVDNKGGTIDDSVVAGRDANGSGNQTEVTQVDDAFNTDASETVTDSFNDASTDVDGSFNTDASVTVSDSGNTSFSGSAVNDSYDVHAPAASAQAQDAETAAADPAA